MCNNLKFNLTDGSDEHRFIKELADHFSIKKERSVSESFAIYDTFDWRLFNNSLVLYESGNRLFLRRLSEDTIIQSIKITSPPVFIWDFPDSELKDQLAPVIKVRALFKLVEVHSRSRPYRILNKDEKTVARLVYKEIRPSRDKSEQVFAAHFCLKPVRGYPKYSRNLAKRLEKSGFLTSEKDDIYFKAIEFADKNPGSYSSKLNIQLDPDMRSDEAAKVILRFLLQVIRINEANIEKDLDTEFVHDFRVAIRRTRSALGQIKNVFPAKATDRFKKDFAFMGKLSNQLRDLDVYLLKEDTYKAVFPAVLLDDIDPLFDYLREERAKALREFISGLKSKECTKILEDWEIFLNEPPQDYETASNADLPIIDLARKRIYKRYRDVVKTGKLILENTEDKMLHILRIKCKKLRYLIEFFSSLFPDDKIRVLIEQLKKLQDNLGDFNDLRIQVEYVLNITEKLPVADQQSKRILVSIGSLIGWLDREKQITQDAFAETFTVFASPVNKRLFRELFTLKKKEAVS